MTGWAFSLRRAQASSLAKLNHLPDVRVGEMHDVVWARGRGTADELGAILARVPASRFFEIVHGDRLRPRGRLLPTGRLPDLRWVSLSDWLSVRLPTPAMPGALMRSAELALVDGRRDADEELLLCRGERFRTFLLHGPEHRLRRLEFVVHDRTSEVLVRGRPLPPLPGERFVLAGGVATPAGRSWSPAVSVGVVRAWLGLRDGVIALWRADGTISEIAESAFVDASRRAGRRL